MKMQSEMNQMKTRLREDFSREVMALEDEIEALRKSYETRDYTTDEGLGKSMSRIRFTEESSDDELERLIKKREKRLQKRFSRSNRTVDSDADSLYESSFADFNKNMRKLIKRVDAL